MGYNSLNKLGSVNVSISKYLRNAMFHVTTDILKDF